ncbi:sugar ABC transporter substrate-binding protein [Shinella sp.]|uniref:sugar ABC transporter substrate-binding protein n=1 Tax=Shinella sp. TaxID=1870904 RepID=UPI0029B81C76|nr:sugar ABC transporter substrate-binding protein [Shinella sp.]MDX3975345.1 sugar ABC transporter substrate-binding protein [Shinella sp.]
MAISKFTQVLLASALGLGLYVSPAVSQDKATIGIVAIDLQSSFFVRMQEAGDKAAADYGVATAWQSAEGSPEKQVSLIENFINQKVSAILIDPLDKNALVPVIKKAQDAGINVITMGNKIEGAGNYATLYPDYQNMSEVARALAHSIGGKGEVALLIGARGNYVSDTREKGFTDTLAKEFPDVKVVGIQPAGWDPSKAADIAQTWLTTYPDLKGLSCISDTMCLGANSVAETMGKSLKIAGYDGDAEMAPLMESGAMSLDVLTGAYRVGYWNVAVAARLSKSEELPRDLYMPTHFIATDASAAELEKAGLKLNYITPQKAQEVSVDYSSEFGPQQPTSAMSVEN